MQKTKTFFGILLALTLASCGNQQESKTVFTHSEDKAKEESPSATEHAAGEDEAKSQNNITTYATSTGSADNNANYVSSAAQLSSEDEKKKLVRSANLRFKVKNVMKSTYYIEDIAKRHAGFVTYTNLTSRIEEVTTTTISEDSLLEATKYTMTNDLTLRVPNTKLDTALKEIAREIDFLDMRTIKVTDVSLQMLSNDLAQKRATKNEERLTKAIDNRGKKLGETADAEDLLDNKKATADNAKLENLALEGKVAFSEINLSIYQTQMMKRVVLPNEKNIKEYEPSLISKFVDSLAFGWSIVNILFFFLLRFWFLILLGIGGYVFYKKYGK
jgi:hypothetical protein